MYKLLEGEQVPLDLFEEFALRDYLLEEKPIAQSAHEFSKEPNKPIKLDAGKLERLGNRIKALHAQQTTNTFALGLAVWFIVCAAIYAGGWAVGWIAAGFRKHAP